MHVAGDHREMIRVRLPPASKDAEFCRYRCRKSSRQGFGGGFYRGSGNFCGALVCTCTEHGRRTRGSAWFGAGTEDSGSCYFGSQWEMM